MKTRWWIFSIGMLAAVAVFFACKGDHDINIFTVNQDIEFGQALDDQILSDPDTYTVLDRGDYPDAYAHLERIRDNILASGELKYEDKFPWQVTILDDTTLNAFCAPGGYMYVYTGIIKFLDNEAEFAGVMGHEMAHADRRHSTDNMTKQYGISLMVDMILGKNPGQLAEIAAGLASGLTILAFTRENEAEADEYAVRYLNESDYYPPALGDFFVKLESLQTSGYTPTLLRSHPPDKDRLNHINEVWESLGSKDGELFEDRYQDFKNSLPD